MNVTGDGVPADALIGVIKTAIARAGVPIGGGKGLRATSAQVTLQVVASKSGGGSLQFCVPFLGAHVGAGGKISDRATHTLSMSFVPREPRLTQQMMGMDSAEDALVSAISTVRDTMAAAAGGADPWALSAATVDICFGVTRSGSISLGLDGDLGKESVSTIRLTLQAG